MQFAIGFPLPHHPLNPDFITPDMQYTESAADQFFQDCDRSGPDGQDDSDDGIDE